MHYCPKCGGEFYDDVVRCTTCDTQLIDEAAWREHLDRQRVEDDEVFVAVHTLGDQFEADVITDMLDKEQIPWLVRSFQDTSFDGLYVAQQGWGLVMVPEEYRRRAQELIAALK